jgi:hypothetical protein
MLSAAVAFTSAAITNVRIKMNDKNAERSLFALIILTS